MTEQWKDIPGYEGRYQVSDQGQVRGPRGVFKLQQVNSGYLVVRLRKPGARTAYTVHRLVAEAFIGQAPSESHQVNHINGAKTDNCAVNLEWATPKENYAHAVGTGLFTPGKRVIGTPLDGGAEREFSSAADAADTLTGNRHHGTNITHCLSGRYKSSCGYRWRYADA